MGLVTQNKNKYEEGTKISEYFSLPEINEKPLHKKRKKRNEKKSPKPKK